MCDIIIMPDGSEIDSIDDDYCLCESTQKEILTWIVSNLPKELELDQALNINRTPFGYCVSIENKDVTMDAVNKDKKSDWDEIDWTDESGSIDFQNHEKEIAKRRLQEGIKL